MCFSGALSGHVLTNIYNLNNTPHRNRELEEPGTAQIKRRTLKDCVSHLDQGNRVPVSSDVNSRVRPYVQRSIWSPI